MIQYSGGRVLAAGLLLLGLTAQAQKGVDPMSPVALSSETLTNGWQMAGSVAGTPDSPKWSVRPGSSIIVGGEQPLTLLKTADDFRLRINFLVTQRAAMELSLPGGQKIRLDAPDVLPLVKAPGLWQTLEVRYQTGRNGQAPILEKMVLNGVTIREGDRLPVAASTGTVQIRSLGGMMALQEPMYQILSDKSVVKVSNVSYKLYEGEAEKAADLTSRKVVQEGALPAITHEVAYGQTRRYSILYTADMEVLQPGPLTFTVQQGGIAGLQVDGKDVVPAAYADLGQPQTVQTNITPGKHQLTVFFSRSWPRPGLGVFVSGPGTRPQPLHPAASLPEPDPVGLIAVNATDRPNLIRSFVQLPDEKKKRTHCLSVGTPAGFHYTIDLNQGALVQVWKGSFADVTEMWHERGEPQLLKPLGAVVLLNGQSTVGYLSDNQQAWPDTLNDEKDFVYKGWKLNAGGYPTLRYAYRGADITDFITPTAEGLSRTITVNGGSGIYTRLAAGTVIEEVGKGLYAVNNRTYYVRLDPKVKPIIRNNRELLLPVSNGSVQYSIIW